MPLGLWARETAHILSFLMQTASRSASSPEGETVSKEKIKPSLKHILFLPRPWCCFLPVLGRNQIPGTRASCMGAVPPACRCSYLVPPWFSRSALEKAHTVPMTKMLLRTPQVLVASLAAMNSPFLAGPFLVSLLTTIGTAPVQGLLAEHF